MTARAISRRGLVRRAGIAAALLAVGLAAAPAVSQNLARRLLRYSAVIDGSGERALRWPVDVASGSSDELAVADAWSNRLVLFRRVGAGWSTEREVTLPAAPAAVAYSGGRYVVAVRGAAKLFAVAGSGSSAPPQESALPEGILPGRLAASSDGALLLWDSRGRRVVKLRDGVIATQVAIDGAVTALTSDGTGGFWAAMGAVGEVRRFDGTGNLLATWSVPADAPVPAWPSGVAMEPGGRLFVLDGHAHRVVVLDSGGVAVGVGAGRGWEPGQLYYPAGLVRMPNGMLLVGDGGNGRAQLFDLIGAGPN